MAIDYALLRSVREGSAFLRLYRWQPGCLSFGRNEPAAMRYDRARIAALGLDAVRRPTGGRAVWHEAELTYAVAAGIGAFGSLPVAYLRIHQMIATALRRLGVPAAIAPAPAHTPGPGAGACFASAAGGEITVGGRKLVGSAQVREGNALLQHGSILLDGSQERVAAVGRTATPLPEAMSLRSCLGRTASPGEVTAAVVQAAGDLWPGSWIHASRDPQPSLVSRFASPAWTWRK